MEKPEFRVIIARGTLNMINTAKAKGLMVRTINYKTQTVELDLFAKKGKENICNINKI